MSALSGKIIKEFCVLCQWARTVWDIHKTIQDNLYPELLKRLRCPYVLSDFSIITQEYCLLQIVKLHDPALQNGKINLSIDYVIRFGGWDDDTLVELRELEKKLSELKEKIISTRNKVISHNDLETILKGKVHGAFAKDKDIEYFENLQKFVNILHEKVRGGGLYLRR